MESQGRADNSSCGGFDVDWIRDPIKRRETKTVKGDKRFSFAPFYDRLRPLRREKRDRIKNRTFYVSRRKKGKTLVELFQPIEDTFVGTRMYTSLRDEEEDFSREEIKLLLIQSRGQGSRLPLTWSE